MAWKGIKYPCIKNMSKVNLISCPILIVSKVYQRSARDKVEFWQQIIDGCSTRQLHHHFWLSNDFLVFPGERTPHPSFVISFFFFFNNWTSNVYHLWQPPHMSYIIEYIPKLWDLIIVIFFIWLHFQLPGEWCLGLNRSLRKEGHIQVHLLRVSILHFAISSCVHPPIFILHQLYSNSSHSAITFGCNSIFSASKQWFKVTIFNN